MDTDDFLKWWSTWRVVRRLKDAAVENISIHGKVNVGKEFHWFHCGRVGRFGKIAIQNFLHTAKLIGYLVCSSELGRMWKVKKTCDNHYLAQQKLLPQLTKAGIMRLKALNNKV